jgi:hypothetical protein
VPLGVNFDESPSAPAHADIHERSRGNPFVALELARALDADADPALQLPVPETLDELVRARISGLPTSTRKALAFASALGTASETMLERAGVTSEALEPGVAAHVIARDNATIRFPRVASSGPSIRKSRPDPRSWAKSYVVRGEGSAAALPA